MKRRDPWRHMVAMLRDGTAPAPALPRAMVTVQHDLGDASPTAWAEIDAAITARPRQPGQTAAAAGGAEPHPITPAGDRLAP